MTAAANRHDSSVGSDWCHTFQLPCASLPAFLVDAHNDCDQSPPCEDGVQCGQGSPADRSRVRRGGSTRNVTRGGPPSSRSTGTTVRAVRARNETGPRCRTRNGFRNLSHKRSASASIRISGCGTTCFRDPTDTTGRPNRFYSSTINWRRSNARAYNRIASPSNRPHRHSSQPCCKSENSKLSKDEVWRGFFAEVVTSRWRGWGVMALFLHRHTRGRDWHRGTASSIQPLLVICPVL